MFEQNLKYLEAEIILAEPRGFCAGVDRAISIVERILEIHGHPIYVKHEIVHNEHVVKNLQNKGVVFVNNICDIPKGRIVIFSAHGVSQSVKNEAYKRKLKVFDATCPLVTKVHREVIRLNKIGREIIMIGHRNHPEVEGTLGQVDKGIIHFVETFKDVNSLKVNNPENLSFVTQTTLSINDSELIIKLLRKKFPNILGPKKDSDICYATQNRQEAVQVLSKSCDLILVIGSKNSSNSNRLCEVAKNEGIQSYLINDESEINSSWLLNSKRIGITAGASAPEILVKNVIVQLKKLGAISVRTIPGLKETVHFPLIKELAI
ncbi:MAG: 4-hydroxy-3-methylbut-2-enyl diphosphate reductase [Bordetella sp.]|nr:MAG: 4-hydroxy-3-methylbut-2-enyl diphosphate reductase [Bordetella sp.]